MVRPCKWKRQIGATYMSTKWREPPFSCNAPLYRFVFRGTFSFTTVFMLCVAFVFSSFHLAFANEEAGATAGEPENVGTTETIETETQEVESVEEPIVDSAEEAPEEISEPEVETVVESNESNTETAPEVTAVSEVTETETEPMPEAPAATEATSTEQLPEIEASVEPSDAGENASPAEEEIPEVEETIDEEVTPELAEAVLGTSTEATTTPVQVDTVINDSNYYQFSREECVRVADGSFYCGGAEETPEPVFENGLFAAPDSGGDLEIFLRFDGIETQITSNDVDDAAPYYDSHSDTIVWHRLIDDRYQIISYDIESGEEKQLTHGTENNMEPSRYGDLTAWQSWVGNNWEIVLLKKGSTEQLTKSPEHDIAPLIYESFVLWNTTGEDGVQQIAMYDLENEEITLIKDEDGASVRNPRMVLVYETANEHGDIMTKGFDLESKTVVPLAATPRPTPKEIPESDQTGETRALIQNKSSSKESELLDGVPEPVATSSGSTTPPKIDPAASTTPETVAPSATTTNTIVATTSEPTVIEDVVVPVYEPPQATMTPIVDPTTVINDVVIPPFSATSTD